MNNPLLDRLRYHVTGAIERGEATAIVEVPATKIDHKAIPPQYRDGNPKLDFYGSDGRYLYSSNWYRSIRHAAAHAPASVSRILRSTKH